MAARIMKKAAKTGKRRAKLVRSPSSRSRKSARPRGAAIPDALAVKPGAHHPMITAASPARRSIDVQTLTVFLDSLQSYSADLVQYLKSGQSLCHYTTLEGLIGIITGNDLWLTHSRYSNDNEEMNYGHRLVDEVLDELKTNAAGDSAKLKWLEKLRAQIQAAREDEVYICCFVRASPATHSLTSELHDAHVLVPTSSTARSQPSAPQGHWPVQMDGSSQGTSNIG